MARTRNLKPGFFQNEDLAECDPLSRLFFAGMWCWADADGVLEYRPKRLKATILPYDQADPEDLLNQLERHGFIERFKRGGETYLRIRKFREHQSPHPKEPRLLADEPQSQEEDAVETPEVVVIQDAGPEPTAADYEQYLADTMPSEAESRLVLAEPGQVSAEPGELPAVPPLTFLPSLTQSPPNPPKGGGAGVGRNGREKKNRPVLPGFDEFWALYPKKVEKQAAVKAWSKLPPHDLALKDKIVAAVRSHKLQDQWTKDGGRYIPYPASWLNGRRWEDELAVSLNGEEDREAKKRRIEWENEQRRKELFGG